MFHKSVIERKGYYSAGVVMLIIGLILIWVSHVGGQISTEEPSVGSSPQRISLWSTVAAGGVIGYLILLMSLVSL